MLEENSAWWIYQGTGEKHDDIKEKITRATSLAKIY